MQPILTVERLSKQYAGRGAVTRAIEDISFQVGQGEFVGIMGPSGSGKTTLLNCIATIDSPTGGRVLVEGREITALRPAQLAAFRRERLGFIFQDCNLLDTLTAFENIALALTISGTPAGEIDARVRECARLLDITSCLERYPYQLSGGQNQRVAAARAIITQPALVLADEPTGALDSQAARLLLERLTWLNHSQGTTILMVTHDAFTASYCSRILFLRDGALFTQLERGAQDRRAFFRQIIDVVARLGGEQGDVL
jgi:putative ABC transport system ATP-binding protein